MNPYIASIMSVSFSFAKKKNECLVLAHGLTVAFFNLQKLKKSTFSRLYTLWSCKFIIQNSLYSVLDKNTKNSSWSVNSVVFLLPKFVQFIFFSRACVTRYFVLKVCMVILYTVGYIEVFVLNFLKDFKFEFSDV
jgi:hypothetical protein